MPALVEPQQELDCNCEVDTYHSVPIYMNSRAQCKLLMHQAYISIFKIQEIDEDDYVYIRRQRLIQQIISAYSILPFRSQIEKMLYEPYEYEYYRAWSWYLLFIWENMSYQSADSLHWMKLMMDHMFRMTELCNEWEWETVQSEMIDYLKDNGTFVKFYQTFYDIYYPKWVEILRQMNTNVISSQTEAYTYSNLLHTLKKVIWIWNFSHRLLKPGDSLLSSRSRWDQIHQTSTRYNRSNQRYVISAENVISSHNAQIHQSFVLQPLIHLEKPNLMNHVVLSNRLLDVMISIYQRLRKSYDSICVLKHLKTTLNMMQKEREYIGVYSTYNIDIQRKYSIIQEDIDIKINAHKRLADRLMTIVFNPEWYKLIQWNLIISRGVHWMTNNLFQNIGFLMLPFAKIKQHIFREHTLPKRLVEEFVITAKQMYREHWGNIQHLSQLYMFLSNSMYFDSTFSFVKKVLIDPRFGQPTHQVYESTQSYNTNMRIIFELLKSGIDIPRNHKTNIIQFIYQIFQECKQTLNTVFISNRLNQIRLTSENLNRKFNANIRDGNCLIQLYDMHRQPSLLRITNTVEFFEMVVKWVVKQRSFSRIDVLQLEQMIRKMWILIQRLSFTEQGEFLYGLNLQRYITSNPFFTKCLLLDNDVDISWWGLHRSEIVSEKVEGELDSITFIRMEHPITLPSGEKVDRSTYQLLLQSDGKDPFTREELLPLSDMEQ